MYSVLKDCGAYNTIFNLEEVSPKYIGTKHKKNPQRIWHLLKANTKVLYYFIK